MSSRAITPTAKPLVKYKYYDELILDLVKNGAKFGGVFDVNCEDDLVKHSRKKLPPSGLSWRIKINGYKVEQIDIFAGSIDPETFTCKCQRCLNTTFFDVEETAICIGVKNNKLTSFSVVYSDCYNAPFDSFDDLDLLDLHNLFTQIHIKFCNEGFLLNDEEEADDDDSDYGEE